MYDYSCPHCGTDFEDLRPMAERATAPCPKCGKEAQKVLSSFFTGGSSKGSTPTPGGSCGVGPLGGG
ncbi:MAG: zinc ribbon domain-containing protein [Planctomycetota bacterium]|jgi:putative FmdB family regulatory protein